MKEVKKVFGKGIGNAESYRIPSIIITRNNVLIAIADERIYSNADNPNKINKVMRRSFDKGETWEEIQLIVEESGDSQLNSSAAIDPCLLYDDVQERVFLLYSHTPPGIGLYNSERSVGGIIDNQEIPTSYLMLCSSDDDGVTWTKPICLNNMVKDPLWGFIGSGPGIGVRLKSPRYKGRLVFPIYYGMNKIQPSLMASIIYSDDGGSTWHCGKPVIEYNSKFINDGILSNDELQFTESQVIEKDNGELLIFLRNHNKCRRVAISTSRDGGVSWENLRFNEELVQPICQLSALKFHYNGKPCVVIINPANTTERINGTIYLSEDDGLTFPYSLIIKEGTFIYNSSVYLGNGMIGVLFEPDWISIDFVKFSVEWIKERGYNGTFIKE